MRDEENSIIFLTQLKEYVCLCPKMIPLNGFHSIIFFNCYILTLLLVLSNEVLEELNNQVELWTENFDCKNEIREGFIVVSASYYWIQRIN